MLCLATRHDHQTETGNDRGNTGDGRDRHVVLFLRGDLKRPDVHDPLGLGELHILDDEPHNSERDQNNANQHQIAHVSNPLESQWMYTAAAKSEKLATKLMVESPRTMKSSMKRGSTCVSAKACADNASCLVVILRFRLLN